MLLVALSMLYVGPGVVADMVELDSDFDFNVGIEVEVEVEVSIVQADVRICSWVSGS